MSRHTALAHAALLTTALIYGANYLIAKNVMTGQYLNPDAFIWLRVSFALLMFWIIPWKYDRPQQLSRRDVPYLALCALFGVALNQLLFFKGLKLSSPINASIMMISAPIMVLVFSLWILRTPVRWYQVVGIGMGAIGAAVLILSQGQLSWGNRQAVGSLLVLLNASSYALYLVLVKRLMRRYNPLYLLQWLFLFGWIFVQFVAWDDLLAVRWSTLPVSAILSIAYVLFFTTFVAYLFNIWALKHLHPAVAGAYIYLQPPFATFFSMVFAGEQLKTYQIIAALCIGVGVYLTSKK